MIRRSIWLTILLATASGAASVLPGQKIKEITVVLGQGQVSETLPFDVPFLLKGATGGDLRRITVTIRDVTDTRKAAKQVCEKSPEKPRDDALRTCVTEALDDAKELKESWKGLPTSTWAFTGDTFYLSMHPIEASRHYWLRFTTQRKLSNARLTEFQKAATNALDVLLRTQALESRDTEALALFDRQVCDAVRSVMLPEEELTDNSLCGAGWPGSETEQQIFNLLTLGVEVPQADEQEVLGEIAQQMTLGQSAFEKLNAARYRRVIDSLWVESKTAAMLKPASAAYELMNQTNARAARCGTADRLPGDAATLPSRITECEKAFEGMEAMREVLTRILRGVGVPGDLFDKIATKLNAPGARAALTVAVTDNGTMGYLGQVLKTLHWKFSELAGVRAQRPAGLAAAVNALMLYAEQSVILQASTVGDFNTFKTRHLSGDAGLVYLMGLGKVTEYIGTNVYFRPINRDAPLSTTENNLLRRLSFLIGATNVSLDDSATRQDLIGGAGLLTGFGYRLTDIIKFSAGTVWFRSRAREALRTDYDIAGKPFFTLSLDIDVKGVPEKIADWFKF